MFPTTVIGSLPRPDTVRDLILDRNRGIVSAEQADGQLDLEIESAIDLQERAGLEEITDGERRRESYVKVFAERIHGFEHNINPGAAGLNYPAAVAPIESGEVIAAHAAANQVYPAVAIYYWTQDVASRALQGGVPDS